MAGKAYNGHPSWALWNVALWVANDEGLYHAALDCIRVTKTKQQAAELLLEELRAGGQDKTPDGARYTKTSLLHAMRGLE